MVLRRIVPALLGACLSSAPGSAPGTDPGKLLIIAVDGTRPDALQAASAPSIESLFDGAAYSWQAQAAAGVGDYPVSGSGYSSMLTGVWCAKHGVCENDFSESRFDLYPVFFCRLKATRPDAVVESIVRWGPLSPNLMACADVNLAPASDAAATDEGVRLLTETDPDVLFFHLEDVDTAGHTYGFSPDAAGYIAAIEKADERVGRLLAALRARPSFAGEDWLTILTTDHGGKDKDHHRLNCPECTTIFMAVGGGRAEPWEIVPAPVLVDVAATALTSFGVPIDPAWGLDGRAVGLRVEPPPPRRLPGDCTGDAALELSDAICILVRIFRGGEPLPCGDGSLSGANVALLDSNGDGAVEVSDAVHLLLHLFAGGPPPAAGAACVPLADCPGVCE